MVKKVIINGRPGACFCCKAKVAARAGFAFLTDGWKVSCSSSRCLGSHEGLLEAAKPVSGPQSTAGRALNAQGELTFPSRPTNDELTLVRAMPGAEWKHEKKVWRVSLEAADRARVLELADKLQLDVEASLRTVTDADFNAAMDAAMGRAACCAAEGRPLRDYQYDGVKFLAGRKDALISDDMGLGKAQPLDAKILTPSGWAMMRDIEVGSLIIGSNGHPTKVTGVYPQGDLRVFDVMFSDGSHTECCEDHLWAVQTPSRRKRGSGDRVLSAQEIMANGLHYKSGGHKHFVPIVKPVEFSPAKGLPLNSYLLGVLIGDGSFTQGSVSIMTPDSEIAEWVRHRLPNDVSLKPTDIRGNYRISGDVAGKSNSLIDALRSLGLYGHSSLKKFIPSSYQLSSSRDRIALLQGLLDTDGWVQMGVTVQYSTSSKRLAEDVCFLVQSLGGTCRQSSKIPKYTYRGQVCTGERAWRLTIRLPKSIPPFRLPKKRDALKQTGKYLPCRAIDAITSAGVKPCQCIRVEAADHLYLTDDCIVTHNTIQALVALPPNAATIVVCPASLKWTWHDECLKWRPDLTPVVCAGRKGKKAFRAPAEGELVIINYDVLPAYLKPVEKLDDAGKKVLNRKGKVVKEAIVPANVEAALANVIGIFDECQKAKNHKAQRSQKVTELCNRLGGVWGATGTPLMNRPLDLWGVLSSLGLNWKVFGSWKAFLRCFGGYRGSFGYEFSSVSGPETAERLRRVMLRRVKADVLKDLPAKQFTTLRINGMKREIYKELSQLQKVWGDTIGAKKLPPFEAFSEIRAKLAEARIPAMIEYVENFEDADEPLVVMSDHLAPLNELRKREGWDVIDGSVPTAKRNAIVKKFQAGELKGVGVSITAGGQGLTLTRASNMLFVSMNWVPSENTQAEDRIHRIGQANAVNIVRMVSDHDLDRHVTDLLIEKSVVIAQAVDGVATDIELSEAPASRPAVEIVEEDEATWEARMALQRAAVAKEANLEAAEMVELLSQAVDVTSLLAADCPF